jgi:ribosomal protein L32
MQTRFSWWWWVALALLLLAPGPAGRLLLDLVGGLSLLIVLLPLLVGGGGWIAWQLIQRRLRSCPACGFRSLNSEVCPACGTLFTAETGMESAAQASARGGPSFDASDVTVDVSATDLGRD